MGKYGIGKGVVVWNVWKVAFAFLDNSCLMRLKQPPIMAES